MRTPSRQQLLTLGLGCGLVVVAVLTAAALRLSWGSWYWASSTALALPVAALALSPSRGALRSSLVGSALALVAVAVSWWLHWPGEPSPTLALALAVLTCSAVRHLPRREAIVAASGAGLVVAASQAAYAPRQLLPVIVGISLVCWLGGVAAGTALRLVDQRRAALEDSARQQVRLELARELHDVVAHHVTGIAIQAQAGQLVAPDSPHDASDHFHAIEGAAVEALASMRRVVGQLRDGAVPFVARCDFEALAQMVDHVTGPDSFGVDISVSRAGHAWPVEVEVAVMRVVQEAVTNVVRHGRGVRSARIIVNETTNDIEVLVSDDGHGSALMDHSGGFGILGMQERVSALGGTLYAGPGPGAGWMVTAHLPLTPRAAP